VAEPARRDALRALRLRAEEYDVALAIDRLEQAVDWKVERVERSWAGLRSFAPDRVPVYGFATGGRTSSGSPARAASASRRPRARPGLRQPRC
jgi:glycine/D-amino acid oxidase-like deaminating enzyme